MTDNRLYYDAEMLDLATDAYFRGDITREEFDCYREEYAIDWDTLVSGMARLEMAQEKETWYKRLWDSFIW